MADDFTATEKPVLLMLSPYRNGAYADLGEYKPETMAALQGIAEREYCTVTETDDGRHHLQLTAKGWAAVSEIQQEQEHER